MLNHKKLTISFLLLLALSGFLAKPASAIEVEAGDTVTFKATNQSGSAGPMEGVTEKEIKMPPFVTLPDENKNVPATINPGDDGELVFIVGEPEEGKERSGTISFKYEITMQPSGLPCISRGWKDKLGDWAEARFWTRQVYIEVPEEEEEDEDEDQEDVDNSDPTYIQLNRKTLPEGKQETPYQFSPTASPGVGDTLDIEYSFDEESLVTILIYDSEGNLVRTLVYNDLRDAGTHIDQWDGKNDEGELVPDGAYRFIINAVDPLNPFDFKEVTGEIIIDNTSPAAEIGFIKADTPQYGYYTFVGTASDEHIDTYIMECIDEDTQLLIEIGQFSVEQDILASFNGFHLEEGSYTARLTVKDFAGNSTINEFPLVIDRTTNGLKIHIDSISQNVNVASEGYVPTSDEPDVWIDDKLPLGSTQIGDWQWNTEIKYSGEASHTDPGGWGPHGHYFIHSDEPLVLGSGDNIIQYVYLDPADTPSEIMLQFYIADGDGEHRAYWGYNQILTGGQRGTASLFHMGWMPPAGRWLRLKIPAADVGLTGKEVKGVAFVTYNGKAYWDKTTKSSDYNETQKESWLLASQIFVEAGTDTIINYTTSQDASIVMSIHDQENNLIRTLIDEFKPAGFHQIVWDGKDSSGSQAPDGRYYFQFSNPDRPIDSNSFALMDGDFSSVVGVDVQTSVTDSEGNTYEINFDNNIVNKYDVLSNLLFSISNEQVGMESFNPVALELDINDNLFIVDRDNSKIFKLESHGYYLVELPYLNAREWEDKEIGLNKPNAILINNVGNMYVASQDGAQIVKLATARGIIDISNITAEIRVPYENSLVYSYVPIIGSASARDFARYTVEYGFGDPPSVWNQLISSTTEVFDDYKPVPGVRTIYGNLATWHVTSRPYATDGLPMGVYTIRLTVYTQHGTSKQDTVRVEVARRILSWGGWGGNTVASPDGLVTLTIPSGAIDDDAELISIKPVDTLDAPQITSPDLILVSKIYEFRPPGFEFLKECELKMYYTDSQIADVDVDENTLKIYRWNPINQSWVYVYADLDTVNNVLTTNISKFNDFVTYYAIIADPPPAPVIYQPASPTIFRNITVYGKAAPSVKVELFVDGISQGMTDADVDTGYFVKPGVLLSLGDNYLTAQASDPAGNLSDMSDSVLVEVILNQPSAITSLDFKTSDFSQDLSGVVSIGDTLYMELVGTDADSSSIDGTTATLTSSITDPDGISIQLLETGLDTGIYRGTARVAEASNSSNGEIGVSLIQVETITVTSDVDTTKQDSINTKDIEPPPAPTIYSSTHPSLCQDTFEFDLDQWSNKSNSYGATVARTDTTSSTGNYSLELINEEEAGDFASYIRSAPFDARQYPIVSFDYRIPPGVKINLIAYVNGMWKEVVFTDEPKTVRTFEEDLYRTIGTIKDVVADNQWHYAEFNLYNMLREDDPSQAEYIVEEFFMADYDLTGWMELVMGQNEQGATYYIDNFIISEGGKSNNSPVFSWVPNDAGVIDYSYVLDTNPGTIPNQTSEGSSTSVTYTGVLDGIWYFHLRSMDGGGNWGPANHYRIIIDTVGPTADTPQPEDGSFSGSLEIKLHITDAGGCGINPDTISLEINEVVYDMSSGGMGYDLESETLIFSLWKVTPAQQPWPDESTVQAKLLSCDDMAGNPPQEVFSWSWTVDYSKLVGGYLSLLTTKGGYTPAWSADGSQIAFMSERSGNQDIWVIDSDDYAELNGTVRQLTSDEGDDHHPAWSPVDDRIVFVSDRDGVDNLWIINADGSGLIQITNGLDPDSHPTWSADGAKVVFSRADEIWMINADGTDEAQITDNLIEYNLEPAWSSDGKQIAFRKSLYVDTLWVMDADGSNEILLTESGADTLPAWSNQSDRIFFVTTRDETSPAIWVINSDGSQEKSFIENNGIWWDSEPAQSPVNERLAFQSTRNGLWNIWVMTGLDITDIAATPDPFSPNNDGIEDTTDIKFDLLAGGVNVDLKIYDSGGDLIRILLDQGLGIAGENRVTWDGRDDYAETVADGTYTYRITIVGSGGAETIEKSGTVDVDTTPPSFSSWIIPDIDEDTFDLQSISVTVTDSAGINTSATQLQYGIAKTEDEVAPTLINWTDFGKGSFGTVDLSWSNYPNNYLYLRCYAEDVVGNAVYSDVQKELIDSVNHAPGCKVVSPNGGEIWSGTKDIGWSAIDIDGDVLSITIDYSQDAGSSWTNIISGLANDGSYSWDTKTAPDSDRYLIRVRAYDGAAWAEDQSDSHFTVDNTPPAITIEPVTTPTNQDVELSYVVSDNLTPEAKIQVRDNQGRAPPFLYTQDASYNVTLTATDLAANEASDSIAFIIDKTPPTTVTDLSVIKGPDPGEAILNWTSPRDSLTSVVKYSIKYNTQRITDTNWDVSFEVSDVPTPANPGLKETLTVSGLEPTTSYYFGLKSQDTLANTSALSNITVLDVTPPAPITNLTAVSAEIGQTVDLDWSGYVEPDDLSYYKIYQSESDFTDVTDVSEIGSAAQGTFTYRVSGLINNMDYYFAVTAVDEAGNEDPKVTTASAIPTTGRGKIEISSEPSGAKVYLGGNYGYLGSYQGETTTTPVTIAEVKEGNQVLQLTYPGYETYYHLVEVISNQTIVVKATLIKSVAIEFTSGQRLQDESGDLDVGKYSTPFIVDWDMDGLKDLLIGNGDGDIILYRNTGTDDTPSFTTGTSVLSGIGSFVSAFVVDWNNDGLKDLLVGNGSGWVDLWLNSGTDSNPVFTTATALDSIHVNDSAIPFVVDYNNDTKKDLLIGDGNGDLNLYLNTQTDQAPLFKSTRDSIPVSLGIENAAPFVVTDWDGDGNKDLIVGDIDGYLNLYLNTGTDDNPAFGTGLHIQAQGADLDVGNNSTPFVVDYNNDGMKDLIIGNSDGHVFLYQASLFAPPVGPEPPTGLTAYARSGKVGLEWNAVDGAASYNIYRADMGDTPIGLSITTIYIDYNVVDGTTYTYTVTALDSSGNESSRSDPVSATPTRERRRRRR